MIDKRLIDYSSQYKDFRKTLKEEGRLLTLEDLMSVVEGFLGNCDMNSLNNEGREALINLGKAHSAYQNL